MNIPHSSTPWSLNAFSHNIICDKNGINIIVVNGQNEQSLATAEHIVNTVNAASESVVQMKTRNLVSEDKATILAALRLYQDHQIQCKVPLFAKDVATGNGSFEPLSFEDIDGLCEEISSGLLVGIGK